MHKNKSLSLPLDYDKIDLGKVGKISEDFYNYFYGTMPVIEGIPYHPPTLTK